MPVKIELLNTNHNDSNELKAAFELKSILINSIPNNAVGNIYIGHSLTLCGQDVRDIDIAVWGSFSDCELFKFYTNDSKYPKKDMQVCDFCIVIELKEHPVDRISFANTHLYAEYNSGKKDVTNQNELQRYSMMNYLNAYCGVNVFVTNVIWLKSVSERELKTVVGNAPVGILPSTFSFSDLINIIIYQGQKPYYEKETHRYVLSATKEIDWMDKIKHNLFRERKTFSELTRQKLELLTQKSVDNLIQQKAPNGILTTYCGKAGTGKTFILLQTALRIASNETGKRCLLLTYNHALVSDIRRLLHFLDIPDKIDTYTVQVQTLHSFFMQLMGTLGISTNSIHGNQFESEYNKHLKELNTYIQQLMDANDIKVLKDDNHQAIDWDFILIDEAQDWNNVEKEILFKVYGADRLIIADGGQQFVRNNSHLEWGGKEILLKTGRRQKSNLVQFVNAVAEEFGVAWKQETDNALIGGRVIISKNYDNINHKQMLDYCKQMKCDNYDMLFLVPPQMVESQNGHSYFRNLQKWKEAGFELFDGTNEQKRGQYSVNADECRLFQYESCRGLEGWVVACLQFDKLLESKKQTFDENKNSDPLVLESKDEKLKKYLWMWTMLPFTRAIDTLIITIKDSDSEIGQMLKKISDQNRDIVSWECY